MHLSCPFWTIPKGRESDTALSTMGTHRDKFVSQRDPCSAALLQPVCSVRMMLLIPIIAILSMNRRNLRSDVAEIGPRSRGRRQTLLSAQFNPHRFSKHQKNSPPVANATSSNFMCLIVFLQAAAALHCFGAAVFAAAFVLSHVKLFYKQNLI